MTNNLFGQDEIDSLNASLNRETVPLKRIEILFRLSENELNYQNAVIYANNALVIADSLALPVEKAKAHNLCGVAWKNCGDIPKSMEHLFAALEYYQKSEDEIMYGEVLMNIGETFRASGKLEKSMEYLNLALAIFYKHNHTAGLAKTYNRMTANSYEKLVNLPGYKQLYNVNKTNRKNFYNVLIKNPVTKPEHDSLFFYIWVSLTSLHNQQNLMKSGFRQQLPAQLFTPQP